MISDRVGLGWRPELAAGIFARLDRIDVVEVIADDYFVAPQRQLRALETLARQAPVVLHGTGMGLAGSAGVGPARVEAMARLVDRVRPAFWSEHLAFVRGGGVEIGHLAAVPRTEATASATAKNVQRAAATVGTTPLMENIATLLEPPGSTLSEGAWLTEVLRVSCCDLLLDLHNIYANGLNHGYDPVELVRQLPAERIGAVHVAGGKWIPAPDGRRRLLDDHRHDVPDPVFELLEEVAVRAPHPLTVILERDGQFPAMSELLAQLECAREALAQGRARQRLAVEGAA
ncbi:MAG: DUF692 domain-containing protein [Acidobacteria bacterium]|nr:DUF692 domain-containing protein [Acidobacteriota bacterium]